eukprot:CAMPEP_0180820038 /NCGR_PEP_ID=MMETSP1038_2-20121128/70066_1 /TAXON_ID=632150 /ORGANISM="Azadinium spinosum, Strain 3D9" /LENGTH=63 /DNA_ID=CAMNT_0022862091 /DNA_START=63 /DNA_END=251 /DNA_ORIENTATION=-
MVLANFTITLYETESSRKSGSFVCLKDRRVIFGYLFYLALTILGGSLLVAGGGTAGLLGALAE